MYKVTIKLPGRPDVETKLVDGKYRIGSSLAAHIQINSDDVCPQHALISVRDDGLYVQDLESKHGTFVDGRRIDSEPVYVAPGSEVRVGPAAIELFAPASGNVKSGQGTGAARRAAEAAPSGSSDVEAAPRPRPAAASERDSDGATFLLMSGIPFEYRKVVQEIKLKVHEELLKQLNLKNLTLSDAEQGEIEAEARETIHNIIADLGTAVPRGVDSSILEDEILNEAVGLGPIEKLLAIDEVTEIMVNGASNIYIEKHGNLYRTDFMYANDEQVVTVIERIVAPIGRRIDESQPMVDGRLADGSRVNAIISPLAIDGPCLTIRKFSTIPLTDRDLIEFGSVNEDIMEFLEVCVLLRKNILISGGTGSGKTSLLNVLSCFIPNVDRIVTIEDAAELRLAQEHVVRLEARPPNIEGRGEVAIRDLVRNALRMRPDRIVVGECRGGEALDMLQAMNTGHDGSLTTLHANSTRDALSRLETLVLMAGFELPLRAIREQIASAISVIVQINRMADGTRKIIDVTEITGMEGEVITAQEIFRFVQEGVDSDGRIIGRHRAMGIVPTFIDDIHAKGLTLDRSVFFADEN